MIHTGLYVAPCLQSVSFLACRKKTPPRQKRSIRLGGNLSMGAYELLATIGTAFTAVRATFTTLFGNEAAAERSKTR